MHRGLVLGMAAALAVMLSACGGGDDTKETAQSTPAATTAAAASTAPPAATGSSTAVAGATATTSPAAAGGAAQPMALAVKAGERGDQYFFEPKDVTVKAGQQVTLTLTNAGPERRHTWKIKNKSGSGDLAGTGQISVNATGTLEFKVSEPGTYEIYCSLPGHADRGQRGTLTVAS